jgi:RNA polymerase sigma-70 factor, ECF subfamily
VGFLYESYAGAVHAYVRRIVRDEHAAEDVTQSVFAKLFDVICKYEPREVPFSAWLLRVARNVALDHLRSPRAMPMAQVHEDARFDDADRERRRSVVEALSALPPEQRRVLVMRHFLGLGPREIATRLGKSEGSIHGLHHRGRTALRLALLELDSAPTTGGLVRATAAG